MANGDGIVKAIETLSKGNGTAETSSDLHQLVQAAAAASGRDGAGNGTGKDATDTVGDGRTATAGDQLPRADHATDLARPAAVVGHAGAATWKPWSDAPQALRDHNMYNVGDQSPFNTPIARVFGRSRDYLIYLTESGTLMLNFNEPVPVSVRPALREFRRLTTTAAIALVETQRRAAMELIAAGLNSAFGSSDSDDALSGLAPAKTFIETRAADQARSNFLLFVTTCSVLVFGVLYYLRYHLPAEYLTVHLREIILGGMAGIVGATISLVQRSEALQIDPLSSPQHRAFHGTMRAMLGMVFGAIVVVLARSNLAFGGVTENGHALFFMALVGGFSERLVPDMISRVAQQDEDAGPSSETATGARREAQGAGARIEDMEKN